MSASQEKIFVVGASGIIGSGVVCGLIKNGIETTAYIRSEQKAKDLFKDELKTSHLTIAVGDYTTIDAYLKRFEVIYRRLFLLVGHTGSKPTSMRDVKETFGKIAYEQGVR
jgi:nucleoside-diphosphate-sugar epimerase